MPTSFVNSKDGLDSWIPLVQTVVLFDYIHNVAMHSPKTKHQHIYGLSELLIPNNDLSEPDPVA